MSMAVKEAVKEEVKIVIILRGHSAAIGIQKPDCDPSFSRAEGDLAAILETIPRLVEEAEQKWQSSPRYPECETDLTPPPPPATRTETRTSRQAPQAQPPMF
jgi:hypothetical protein